MKKIIFLFLLTLQPLMANAHDIEVKNADGKIIYYNYINNNTELEVTYRGDKDNTYSDEYTGIVVIPEEVTYMNRTRKVRSIAHGAFYYCTRLTSVTIPNGVTSIGSNAFSNCSGLTSAIIGDDVTTIGYGAFSYCNKLKSITIGKGLTTIEDHAFRECGLSSITFPNSLLSIGQYAFWNCPGLTSVTIPNNVTSIGGGAFRECRKLTSINIPNGLTTIEGGTFNGCSGLTEVTIPNSVTSIGTSAFYGCSGLLSVTIPNSVTSIGEWAFYGADIPTVVSQIEKPFKIEGKTSDNRTFSENTFINATLNVPKGTIEKYKATEGWKDFVFIEEEPDGDTPETQKCATPTISYENGKLRFSCTTEGATCLYSITNTDIKAGSGNEVQLTTTYKVSVYATKAGYENSDDATLEINVNGYVSGIRGDVNNDGVVSMPDAMFIVNKILNGKFPDE